MYAKRVQELRPYAPGEQLRDREYVKLNANENPYPPSPRLKEILMNFDLEQLRLYPDPDASELRKAFANMVHVSSDMVYAGNGSDEILSFVFYAFFDSERTLLFPEHTYSFYPVYASYYGIPIRKVPLEKDFSISVDRLSSEESGGIIFANPNAPTGMVMPLSEIQRLLEHCPEDKPVVVDEAYIDFGGESAIPLLSKFPNLIIVRTLSKSMCFAGARLGFVIAGPEQIRRITTVKNSFNHFPVDAIVQALGKAACEDVEYYQQINSRVIATREWLTEELRLLGWRTLPSKANFVFTSKEGISGEKIYRRIKENGFLVRYFEHPGIENFVRITIGKQMEMEQLICILKKEFS